MSGVSLIDQERNRQIEREGFGASHDDLYANKPGTLTMAAICYATMAASGDQVRNALRDRNPNHWPWGLEWWKPGPDNTHPSRIRELAKAGALIAAEIDRLQREQERWK